MSILIDGSTQRSFCFPAALPQAFDYYCHVEHILTLLPHIRFIKSYGNDAFRMLYHTLEAGIYHIQITCDVKAVADRRNNLLRFEVYPEADLFKPVRGIDLSAGYGWFTSESMFQDDGKQTRIDYCLRLRAKLPVPLAAVLMPASMRNSIATSVTRWRIREIADGFIDASTADYRANRLPNNS